MKSKHICIIAFLLLTIATEVYLGTYFYASVPNQQLYGSFAPTGGGTYTLQSSISSTQNTITLTSFTEPVSNIPYTMSYIGSDIIYGTISPSSGRSEFISATGITQNSNGTATLTGVTRGESKTPGTGGCVASSTLATGWPGQTQFILSNTPCFYSEYAARRDAQNITGVWTFASTSAPTYDATYNASGNQFVSYNQLNAVAIQGAGTSTEGVLGLVALNQASNLANGTASTTSGAPLVIQNKFATTTPGTLCTGGTWNCIVAAVSGKISQSWLDLTQAFTFSGGILSTASSTFSATTSIAASSITNNAFVLNNLAYKFPSSRGSSGTVLTEDGSGTLSWSATQAHIIASQPNANTSTNQTSTTTMSYVVIPANTISATNGILRITVNFQKVVVSNYCYTEILFGNGSATSSVISADGGSTQSALIAATSTTNEYGNATAFSGNTLTSKQSLYFPYDITQKMYVAFAGKTGNAADTCKVVNYLVEVLSQ